MKFLKLAKALALLSSAIWLGSNAHAQPQSQTFPNHPLQMIVPFTPGAATDQLGRFLAVNLSQRLGQQVVVVNKAGAGSQIGIDFVSKSAPDGYTLLFATSDGMSVLPAVKPRMPYAADRNFTAVARVATTPLALAVSSRVPVRTFAEFVAYAKANPGTIRYGSVGDGSYGHMLGELLGSLTDTRMIHVPYKGMAPVVNDLLAGHIDMALVTPPTIAVHESSNAIRLLAVSALQRQPALPNVPSAREVGLPAFAVEAWFGLFVPKGTPETIVKKLSDEAMQILGSAEATDHLRQRGVVVAPQGSGEFAATVTQDVERWRKFAAERKISLPD